MVKKYFVLIFAVAFLTGNGNTNAADFNAMESRGADSLKVAARSGHTRSYQLGIQLESSLRTGYAREMDYDYKPLLIQFEFQKSLSRSIYRSFQLGYFLQPQLNIVKFNETQRTTGLRMWGRSWEAGVNVGLVLLKPLFRVSDAGKLDLYALGSLGPHYIESCPSRQARGFVFSDNFRLGIRIPVAKHVLFDMRAGIRHLSNASLKQPNGGLDDIMFGAGIRLVQNR